MSEISKRIRAYVNDPTVADNYGAWGALRPDQRRQIRKLCDTCDKYEQAADSMQGTIEKLVVEIERLNAEMTRRQLPSYCQACTEEEAIKLGKEYGRRELAREIFEEIEKAQKEIVDRMQEFINDWKQYSESTVDYFGGKYEAMEVALRLVKSILTDKNAELKKKYTEGEQ